jgi:hypothetical protein
MKKFITPSYTFTPGASGVGTVDLTGIASFEVKYLVAIINQTKGEVIYASGLPSKRYTSVVGTLVTLFYDTSTHLAGDALQVIYEDDTFVQNSLIVDSSGDSADVVVLSTALQTTDKGIVTNTVIHGESTASPGTYVDVKVNPSGSLNTESTLAGLDSAVLGQDTMANSLPVVIASDQSAVTVTGTVTATNPSVGTSGSPIPSSSTLIGGSDGTNLRAIKTDSSGVLLTTQGAASNGSNTDSTVSTVQTLTVPANTVGFILMNLDTSTANIRWRIGATATSSSGQQLQPGRDTGYIPCAANISICSESGTNNFNIQWILSS